MHNNQYGNAHHHRSAEGRAPRQPIVAADVAAAPSQPAASDRVTSTPAALAPEDDAARNNTVPPHRSGVAPDHARAPMPTNYEGDTHSNGHGHNDGDAHRTSSDDVVGGDTSNNDDANRFDGAYSTRW